jgi:ubiquitin related modifier 1
MLLDVDSLIVSDDEVKAGILVLINDADWDLFDGANYVLGRKDRITFISTLHGG